MADKKEADWRGGKRHQRDSQYTEGKSLSGKRQKSLSAKVVGRFDSCSASLTINPSLAGNESIEFSDEFLGGGIPDLPGRKEKRKISYLSFKLSDDMGKTKKWEVVGFDTKIVLGQVMWFAGWRKYCFFPQNYTIFDSKCLSEIITFMNVQMGLRKIIEGGMKKKGN